MILNDSNNTILAAPQINNMTDGLAKYRIFAGDAMIQMSDFIKFMTTASVERDNFIATLTLEVLSVNNMYIKQEYN